VLGQAWAALDAAGAVAHAAAGDAQGQGLPEPTLAALAGR
jgi:hypothetical protein